MFRVFDRAGLCAGPVARIHQPLPQIESLVHSTDAQTDGIELVGPGGLTCARHIARSPPRAPRYNLLDDRVQRALLEVVNEVVQRYGRHPSLRGVAVNLSSRGYAVLPGLEWGLDDATIEQFERETGIQLDATGPNRFALRQRRLTGEHADAWREWRAARVTQFYQRVAELLASTGGDRQLVLTTEELFASAEAAESFVQTSSPSRGSTGRCSTGGRRPGAGRDAGDHGCADAVCRVDGAAGGSGGRPGAQRRLCGERHAVGGRDVLPSPAAADVCFVRRTKPIRVAHAQLLTQSASHDSATRRPYVAALAGGDPPLVVDGGEVPPMGKEEAARQLRSILRALPPGAAVEVRREQNVTVRPMTTAGRPAASW